MVGSVQVLTLLDPHGPHPLLTVHSGKQTEQMQAIRWMGGLEERLYSGLS